MLKRTPTTCVSDVGVVGLAVMGRNLALNVAEKGFSVSVYNRPTERHYVKETIDRAQKEGLRDRVDGYYDMREFVQSLCTPRTVILLVRAGAPVDATIEQLCDHLEPGDLIVDGGNEWYENTERRESVLLSKDILYIGMGISGGEEGARNGPSLMPGGSPQAYERIDPIVNKVSARVNDGMCVTHVGGGGSGNFVKMVHNGIEYGDMQLISEAYDLLKHVCGLSNAEIATVFSEWNDTELHGYLIEITSILLTTPDDLNSEGYLVDKILDKIGAKGTGKWTVQQAAELGVAVPTIATSLDTRFTSCLKDQREVASMLYDMPLRQPVLFDGSYKLKLVADVRAALYASKICTYAQGLNVIRAKSDVKGWNVSLSELARIWKGGCIIRARLLDRIQEAYTKNPSLDSLLLDYDIIRDLQERDAAWRRVVAAGVYSGVSLPSMSASLAYFDAYRRKEMPANLVQAQRDCFGSHTYERKDVSGSFHTEWKI